MKTTLITLLITALTMVHAVFAEDADAKVVKRIGVYDSRAIAVAFIGSVVYNTTAGKELAAKMAESKKAESEGNKENLAKLKAWGQAQQALRHKQGFSTAPVDDILGHITGQLPEIKMKADVKLLVSKWAEVAPEATTSEFTTRCVLLHEKLRTPTAHKSPLRRSVVPPFLNCGVARFEKIVHFSTVRH
jgi:hypothetical protein